MHWLSEMKENWKKCIEQAKESNHTWLHKAAVSAKCLSSHLNGNWQRQWIQCWNYEIAWGGTKGRNALWNMCSFKSACKGTNILLTSNYQSILIHSIPANLVLFSLKFPATKRKKAAPESRNVLVVLHSDAKFKTNSPLPEWGRECVSSL